MNADVSSVLRLMFLSSPPHPSLQQVDNEISKHDLLFFPLLQSHHHPNNKKSGRALQVLYCTELSIYIDVTATSNIQNINFKH